MRITETKPKVYLCGKCIDTTWQDELIYACPDVLYQDPRTIEQNLSKTTFEEISYIESKWLDDTEVIFAYLEKDYVHTGTYIELGVAAEKGIVVYLVDEKQNRSTEWTYNFLKLKTQVYYFHTLKDGIEQFVKDYTKEKIAV